ENPPLDTPRVLQPLVVVLSWVFCLQAPSAPLRSPLLPIATQQPPLLKFRHLNRSFYAPQITPHAIYITSRSLVVGYQHPPTSLHPLWLQIFAPEALPSHLIRPHTTQTKNTQLGTLYLYP